jgi:hypothetical protein
MNKFQKTSTRELKPIFTAVTQSILELLSEGYIEKKEKNKGKWGLTDFFKVFVGSLHHPYPKSNCDTIRHVTLFQKTCHPLFCVLNRLYG